MIPAFCEHDRIGETIATIRAELVEPLGGDVELVVVDDGSPDTTAEAARAAGADVVLRFDENRGKGAAVRSGVLAASGRTVGFCDADLSYEPAQMIPLLEAVESGFDVVVGNRRHVLTRTLVRAGRLRELGGRLINLATHVLLLGQYRDTQCGIKAMRRDVAQVLFGMSRIDRFAFDVELFHLVERHRLSLHEVPVHVAHNERSTVSAARDGLRMLRDLVRIRRWAAQGRYAWPVDVALPGADTSGPAAQRRSRIRPPMNVLGGVLVTSLTLRVSSAPALLPATPLTRRRHPGRSWSRH